MIVIIIIIYIIIIIIIIIIDILPDLIISLWDVLSCPVFNLPLNDFSQRDTYELWCFLREWSSSYHRSTVFFYLFPVYLSKYIWSPMSTAFAYIHSITALYIYILHLHLTLRLLSLRTDSCIIPHRSGTGSSL